LGDSRASGNDLHENGFGVQEGITVEAILVRVLRLGRSCVVCNLLQSRSFDVISRWQYVLAEDSAGRMEFLRRHTWCNRHGWRFKALASPRELGRLHRQLMAAPQARIGELLGQDLEQLRAQIIRPHSSAPCGRPGVSALSGRSGPAGESAGCLARGLASGALRMAFTESAGCCLPHLAAVLALVPDAETARFLLETTRERLGRLAADLDTYEAEAQSRRREFGSAADAPSRAMGNWSGYKERSGMWKAAGSEGYISMEHAEIRVPGRMTEEGQIIVKMIGNRLVTTRRMWAFDPEGRSRCLRDTDGVFVHSEAS